MIDELFQLQEAFASGKLKPGLNIPGKAGNQYTNNIVSTQNVLNFSRYCCFVFLERSQTKIG